MAKSSTNKKPSTLKPVWKHYYTTWNHFLKQTYSIADYFITNKSKSQFRRQNLICMCRIFFAEDVGSPYYTIVWRLYNITNITLILWSWPVNHSRVSKIFFLDRTKGYIMRVIDLNKTCVNIGKGIVGVYILSAATQKICWNQIAI